MLVRQRRLALDLSQRDAAARGRISNQTWLNVENGRGANARSLVQIERALGWPEGTIDAILAGDELPAEAAPDLRAKVESLETEVARLRAAIELLTDRR